MTDTLDRLQGALSTLGMKTPVRVATTADITLSGLQAIDGVTVVEDDRVLVKDQDDDTENGVYFASSGAWSRTKDFDSASDFVEGTTVIAGEGALNAGRIYRVSSEPVTTIGEDDITFAALDFSSDENGAAISNTTLNLDAVDGEVVDVSGAGTINAITLSEAVTKLVRFTGSATLTHSASLVLPGAQSIVCAAGDWAIFRGYASSVVRCAFFQRGSTSQPLIAGEATIASAATVDLGSVREQCVTISGTTAVTSFGSSAATGTVKFCRLSGAAPITASANIITPEGGASIQGASGDCFIAKHEGSGVWRVLNYTRAALQAHLDTGATSTSATSESDLMTFSLPASRLASSGAAIRVRGWGSATTVSTGVTRRMRMYFGATVVADSGARDVATNWSLEAVIARTTSASAQQASGTAMASTGGAAVVTVLQSSPAETSTGAITVKVTGLCTAATGVITQTGLLVEQLSV